MFSYFKCKKTLNYRHYQQFCKQSNPTSKNATIEQINPKLLQQTPGEIQLYMSTDAVPYTSESVQNPTEFVNSPELPGVSPHRLQLKFGVTIKLLRNVNFPKLWNEILQDIKQLLVHVMKTTREKVGCVHSWICPLDSSDFNSQ